MKVSLSTSGFLYHISLVRKLPSIKMIGLAPAKIGREDFYGKYSTGKVFFFEWSGLDFWWEYVINTITGSTDFPEDGWMPVCLRTPFLLDAKEDKLGTMDSRHPAYYITKPLDSDNLSCWHDSWKPLSRISPDKMRTEVLSSSTYIKDDGGYWDIYFDQLLPDTP